MSLVLPLHRYYEALRLLVARLTLFRFLHLAIPFIAYVQFLCSSKVPGRFNLQAWAFLVRHPLSGLIRHGDNEISQVPGQPLFTFALLSDPGETLTSGHCDATVLSL
jgi:hypothetical protein